MTATAPAREVLEALREHGVLLLADRVLPSLTTIVAGEAVRGSWWGHPKGHEIFRVGEALVDHADVLSTRLVSGKVTFVHRRLWPALLRVASGGEPWQIRGLSRAARVLLARVREEGELRASGAAARELELRLLAHAEQEHTETGAHAKRLLAWDRWARRVRLRPSRLSMERARGELERVVAALNARFGAKARLPWGP